MGKKQIMRKRTLSQNPDRTEAQEALANKLYHRKQIYLNLQCFREKSRLTGAKKGGIILVFALRGVLRLPKAQSPSVMLTIARILPCERLPVANPGNSRRRLDRDRAPVPMGFDPSFNGAEGAEGPAVSFYYENARQGVQPNIECGDNRTILKRR
ncbi:MAG: hypothetical protein KIG25_05580 [Eubacteriales bacterium]|nr:hypothetical protein [Eubacteriales bacterium]